MTRVATVSLDSALASVPTSIALASPSRGRKRGREALAEAARLSTQARRVDMASHIQSDRPPFHVGNGPTDERHAPHRAADPYVGRVLAGRYRVDRMIARGGCSRVYRGTQTSIGRSVAIKIVRPDLDPATTAMLEPRFRREAAVIGGMQHPHVVTVLDFGRTIDGTLFLVMEYLQGRTLQSALRRGPLTPLRAVRLWLQIARALRHAHRRSLVHRDIKPGNIMVCPADDGTEHAKLIDFGLAKADDDLEDTQLGMAMGTPQYLSPEQALDHPVDGRADIYSLGVVMYLALTRVHPYDAPDSFVGAVRALREPYPRMATRAPQVQVPPQLEAIVRRSMEKDLDHRYPDVSALIDDLRALEAVLDPSADRDHEPTPISGVAGLDSRPVSSLVVPSATQAGEARIFPASRPTTKRGAQLLAGGLALAGAVGLGGLLLL